MKKKTRKGNKTRKRKKTRKTNKKKRFKKRSLKRRRIGKSKKKQKKKITRRKKVRSKKTKTKKRKKSSRAFFQSFLRIKAFNLKNLFSYVSRPIFEAYYNFQQERKRKFLKAQDAEEREKERLKRERFLLIKKIKEKQLKEEIYYSKELKKDMKLFLKESERISRIQKAKEQQEILNNLKLNKQIASFEARQNREIAILERASLHAEKQNYQELLDRINNLKAKYKLLRTQKLQEKLKALGIEVQGDEDRVALLEKEKRLLFEKSEIENALMPFTRSLRSIAFFCNRSEILGKHLSPLKAIDLSYDTGEVYLKWLDLQDADDFVLLTYLKDNSQESKKVVLEIKTDPDKNQSMEFDIKSIFPFQEAAIDNVVKMIERERNSKKTSEEKQAS